MQKKFLIINGPNLNLLGSREPEIYGSLTLEEIQKYTEAHPLLSKVQLQWFQSNIEGEIVTRLQKTLDEDFAAIIINPAAYSHTSVAIYDALKLIKIPIVEVHLSNTHAREEFRKAKITSGAAKIVMEGLGKNAYVMGILSQII